MVGLEQRGITTNYTAGQVQVPTFNLECHKGADHSTHAGRLAESIMSFPDAQAVTDLKAQLLGMGIVI